MPTIEELFKNKKLQSGQTAEQQYGVRNTKDLPITPYNSLMTIPFKGVQKIRNGTNTFRETKLEAETSGLRVLALANTPFLYGTDTIKFTTKERNIVEDMKSGAKGVSEAGILGTFLNKAEQKGKELLSKIGVALPEQLIPTRIATNKKFGTIGPLGPEAKPGGEYATMVRLQDIKNGNGNFWGKVIADNLQGKPSGNQIIGSALDLGKKALNKLLLGSPSQAAQNKAKLGDIGTAGGYASNFPYSKVVLPWKEEGELFARNDLSTKYNTVFPQKPLEGYNPDGLVRPNVLKTAKLKYSTRKNATKQTINIQRGMTKGADYLNTVVPYNSSDGLAPNAEDRPKDLPSLESYDFIPLKFWSVAKKAAVNFRAVISGISENVSPTWDNNKFVGNPFNFYTYSGIERSVSFSFKVFALNEAELIAGWQKINFLTSLAYPQGYSYNNLGVLPPFIKFTLGSMYNNKEGYIEDLTYEIDDNTTWETATDGRLKNFLLPKIINVTLTIKLVETVGSTYQQTIYDLDDKGQVKYVKDSKGKDTKTPIVKTQGYGKRLYGFGSSNPSLVLKQDTAKNLNQDGSPKPKETVVETPNANQAQKPVNPVAEAPKQPEDPKGKFVTEYKGLKLYSTKRGPFETITSWKGDEKWHVGNENGAAGTQLLTDTEKLYIDGRLENEGKKTA